MLNYLILIKIIQNTNSKKKSRNLRNKVLKYNVQSHTNSRKMDFLQLQANHPTLNPTFTSQRQKVNSAVFNSLLNKTMLTQIFAVITDGHHSILHATKAESQSFNILFPCVMLMLIQRIMMVLRH